MYIYNIHISVYVCIYIYTHITERILKGGLYSCSKLSGVRGLLLGWTSWAVFRTLEAYLLDQGSVFSDPHKKDPEFLET